MHKSGYSRNIIHIISRYSSLSEKDVKLIFHKNSIYADRAAWGRFTDFALLGIGAAFVLAGLVFFFAYNWQFLHKFAKLGIVQLLVAAPVIVILIFKPRELVRNILLTLSCVLVGVLFAVFGQIYQTGADAYDLFLGWTIFISFWVLSTRFEVLWLIFLILLNTTFILYVQQAGPYEMEKWLFVILYVFNVFAVVIAYKLGLKFQMSNWFWRVIALYAAGVLTIGLIVGVFEEYSAQWLVSLILGIITYGIALYYSIQKQSMYLLCVLPVSVVVVFCALFIDLIDGGFGSFIFVSFFIVSSVTLLVRQLLHLNRKWNEQKS